MVCSYIVVKSTITGNSEINVLIFLKWNQHLWACIYTLIKSTSLSVGVLMESTSLSLDIFCKFNSFQFMHSPEIKNSLWLSLMSQVELKSKFHCSLSEKESKFFCIHYILKTKQNPTAKNRTMFVSYIKDHMQKFWHFRERKSIQNRQLEYILNSCFTLLNEP